MLDLLTSPQTAPFAVALVLMFMLFVLEVVALLFGGVNDWLDGLLPDELNAHAELGVDADAGGFVRFLSWLYVGRVPVLMLLVVFLAVFGLTGFVVQSLVHSVFGVYVPSVLAVVLVWFLSLPIVRICAKGLHKILPKDETTAINHSELVGRVGVITIGTATHNQSAQVKVKDTHGQTHYVMAFADDDGQALMQGESVLLVRCEGVYFWAIKNVNGVLVDY